jgi:single-stranded-DNA-specific exonuclease
VVAAGLAASVEQLALQRRALQAEMMEQAFAEIEASGFASAPGIVVARRGWHPGIVGIVAGRIASRYGRPTIVVALEGETGRGG